PPQSTLFCSVLRAFRQLAPGAVLEVASWSPSEVVARGSPVLASYRQLMADFLLLGR
ncbi:hypothetical protein A2U01_0091200, partial [Trifolium medium]|nr:hypothetical protein [Trifolium medium]